MNMESSSNMNHHVPEMPFICIDMIGQVALHLKEIGDIRNMNLLNTSINKMLSMEKHFMNKICYHLVLPNIKDDLIPLIQQKGKNIRNLSIELEETFLKLLTFILSNSKNLQEFSFKCTQLHENVNTNGVTFNSDDIFAITEFNADPNDIVDLNYLRKLILDFSSFVNPKSHFLDLLTQIWNQAKYLEEFLFTCENLGMNQNLSEFNEAQIKDVRNSVLVKTNPYNLHAMDNLKKLFFSNNNSNDYTENQLPMFLCSILNQSKNLEDLHIKCSQLKSDTINLETCNRINKLKKISLEFSYIDSADHIQNFIYRQTYLKDLSLEIKSAMNPISFTGNRIEMHLDKLTLNVTEESDLFVQNLLQTQHKLKELELHNVTNQHTFEHVFEHFTSLEKLTIDREGSSIIFSRAFPEKPLDNLLHFEEKYGQNLTNATLLYQRFPYLRSLKCMGLRHANIGFYQLEQLFLDYVYSFDLRKFLAPNLQQLVIKKLARYDEYLAEFLQCIKNVEIVTIESLTSKENVKDVIGEVLKLEKLKIFKLRHSFGIESPSNIDDDESVGENAIFYKILIDTEKKTVKVCSNIYRKCDDIMEVLRNKFYDFDFIEFCF